MEKGVKTFTIKGDTASKNQSKNQMENISRQGRKMEPIWIGSYR
jgi:hypothetical protein